MGTSIWGQLQLGRQFGANCNGDVNLGPIAMGTSIWGQSQLGRQFGANRNGTSIWGQLQLAPNLTVGQQVNADKIHFRFQSGIQINFLTAAIAIANSHSRCSLRWLLGTGTILNSGTFDFRNLNVSKAF